MWALGALSIDDELEPPCAALAHFALGDLEVSLVLDTPGLLNDLKWT